MSHLTEDDLTLLHYGELTDADTGEARAHLDACEACRRERDAVERLLAMVDTCPVPEPDEGFERDVWRRLQPALRAGGRQRPSPGARLREWLVPSRGWVLAGAMAAVVLVAFALGRYWQPERAARAVPQTAQSGSQDTLRERLLLTALGDHFDRTQVVLVELASASPSDTVDISGEQRRAHDLLATTRIYRRAATEAGDRSVRDVLEALERVLVEVDVSPSQLSAYEMQALQNRIAEQEILFKLRVASAGVRDREQSARPAADRRSAGV